MNVPSPRSWLLILTAVAGPAVIMPAAEPIRLWPGTPPGEKGNLPPEADTTTAADRLVAGRPVLRLGNVSEPTIGIFSPEPAMNTGTGILVCPGGGYNILALDLEGVEICAWLNSIGITGVLLKYRVPAREGRERHTAALEDVQRAMGLVRGRAPELRIDPKRIGVLGFSAGAHLAATLGANHGSRAYASVDAADAVNCRPDFAVLIYPGGLVDRAQAGVLRPEVRPVAGKTPPTFIAMTQDDSVGVENALLYYAALNAAGVSAELHLYPKGGHGYGLRRTEDFVTTWPDRVADWLKAGGWLAR